MNNNNLIAETQRLQIRRFTTEDIPALMAILADKDVMKFSTCKRPLSGQEIHILLHDKIFKDYQSHGFGRYAVIKKEDGTLIGYAGLSTQNIENEGKCIDLGYAFTKQSWGKGYATETAIALVKYAQEILKLDALIALIRPDNSASQKVAVKSGLTFYKNINFDDQLHHLYKINFKQ